MTSSNLNILKFNNLISTRYTKLTFEVKLNPYLFYQLQAYKLTDVALKPTF